MELCHVGIYSNSRSGLNARVQASLPDPKCEFAAMKKVASKLGISPEAIHRCKRLHRLDTATHNHLVKHEFTADGPDRVWFTDNTQHRASDGWVEGCAVIDTWSRKVVCWSIADHACSDLVLDALERARWQRRAIRRPSFRHQPKRHRSAQVHGSCCLQHRQHTHQTMLDQDTKRIMTEI